MFFLGERGAREPEEDCCELSAHAETPLRDAHKKSVLAPEDDGSSAVAGMDSPTAN